MLSLVGEEPLVLQTDFDVKRLSHLKTQHGYGIANCWHVVKKKRKLNPCVSANGNVQGGRFSLPFVVLSKRYQIQWHPYSTCLLSMVCESCREEINWCVCVPRNCQQFREGGVCCISMHRKVSALLLKQCTECKKQACHSCHCQSRCHCKQVLQSKIENYLRKASCASGWRFTGRVPMLHWQIVLVRFISHSSASQGFIGCGAS